MGGSPAKKVGFGNPLDAQNSGTASAFETETENPLAATFEEEPSGTAGDAAAADRPEMERQRFNRGFNESAVELAAQALELGITQYQVDEAMDSDSQDRRRELLIDLIQADASSKEEAEVSPAHRHYFEWALVCSNICRQGAPTTQRCDTRLRLRSRAIHLPGVLLR